LRGRQTWTPYQVAPIPGLKVPVVVHSEGKKGAALEILVDFVGIDALLKVEAQKIFALSRLYVCFDVCFAANALISSEAQRKEGASLRPAALAIAAGASTAALRLAAKTRHKTLFTHTPS